MNKKNKLSSFVNSQTNIIPSYKESPKNSDLFTFNKNFDNNCKKSLNISIDESFSSKSLDYQKNKDYLIDKENYEKTKKVIKDINSQLVKMNYCNLIQTNSIQRLDLSLSFLSSQIETLKLLNKKRKIKLQNILDKFKSSDN